MGHLCPLFIERLAQSVPPGTLPRACTSVPPGTFPSELLLRRDEPPPIAARADAVDFDAFRLSFLSVPFGTRFMTDLLFVARA